MEQDKTRTLLISCQHWAEAGRVTLREGQPGSAGQGGARGVCRVAGAETRGRPGPSRGGEEERQPDTRQGPDTGLGWIPT